MTYIQVGTYAKRNPDGSFGQSVPLYIAAEDAEATENKDGICQAMADIYQRQQSRLMK